MNDESPSVLSHVSLGTNSFERAAAFYDAVLATIGAKRMLQHPGAIAYGRSYPEFWLQVPIDGKPASSGNGTHFGFFAPSKATVHAFWDKAVELGASPDGEPGPRPHYGEPYYGCFVRDLDGHKIEATYWDFELAATSGGHP